LNNEISDDAVTLPLCHLSTIYCHREVPCETFNFPLSALFDRSSQFGEYVNLPNFSAPLRSMDLFPVTLFSNCSIAIADSVWGVRSALLSMSSPNTISTANLQSDVIATDPRDCSILYNSSVFLYGSSLFDFSGSEMLYPSLPGKSGAFVSAASTRTVSLSLSDFTAVIPSRWFGQSGPFTSGDWTGLTATFLVSDSIGSLRSDSFPIWGFLDSSLPFRVSASGKGNGEDLNGGRLSLIVIAGIIAGAVAVTGFVTFVIVRRFRLRAEYYYSECGPTEVVSSVVFTDSSLAGWTQVNALDLFETADTHNLFEPDVRE
jgi:hypothetical protein